MADEATRHIVSEIPMLKIDASRWRAVGAATQGRVSVSYPVCGEQCRYWLVPTGVQQGRDSVVWKVLVHPWSPQIWVWHSYHISYYCSRNCSPWTGWKNSQDVKSWQNMSDPITLSHVGHERAQVWTSSSHGSGAGSVAGSGDPGSDSERRIQHREKCNWRIKPLILDRGTFDRLCSCFPVCSLVI